MMVVDELLEEAFVGSPHPLANTSPGRGPHVPDVVPAGGVDDPVEPLGVDDIAFPEEQGTVLGLCLMEPLPVGLNC